MKIIFATGNEEKMREIRQILADLDVQVLSMKEAGLFSDPEENGSSFEENALIKAMALSKMIEDKNTIILADDSGLEIDALGGDPGIYSARYLGEDTPYSEKNKNLIKRLEGVEEEKRTARFVAAIAAVLPNGKTLTTRGKIEGKIGYEERGANGFGYDPIFYLPDMSCSTAQLAPEEKNRISHRGRALEAMKYKLRETLKDAGA